MSKVFSFCQVKLLVSNAFRTARNVCDKKVSGSCFGSNSFEGSTMGTLKQGTPII